MKRAAASSGAEVRVDRRRPRARPPRPDSRAAPSRDRRVLPRLLVQLGRGHDHPLADRASSPAAARGQAIRDRGLAVEPTPAPERPRAPAKYSSLLTRQAAAEASASSSEEQLAWPRSGPGSRDRGDGGVAWGSIHQSYEVSTPALNMRIVSEEATPLRPIDPLAHRALEALVRAEASMTRQLAADLERISVSATDFTMLVLLTSAGEAGAASDPPPPRRLEGDDDRGPRHSREPQLRHAQPAGDGPPRRRRHDHRSRAATSSPTRSPPRAAGERGVRRTRGHREARPRGDLPQARAGKAA